VSRISNDVVIAERQFQLLNQNKIITTQKTKTGPHVVAVFAGHTHAYSYSMKDKIHHMVIPSPMVTPDCGDCFCTMEFSVKDDGTPLIDMQAYGFESMKIEKPGCY